MALSISLLVQLDRNKNILLLEGSDFYLYVHKVYKITHLYFQVPGARMGLGVINIVIL
jgi:hypothetical protein